MPFPRGKKFKELNLDPKRKFKLIEVEGDGPQHFLDVYGNYDWLNKGDIFELFNDTVDTAPCFKRISDNKKFHIFLSRFEYANEGPDMSELKSGEEEHKSNIAESTKEKTSKFKVGDKVRITRNSSPFRNQEGTISTVIYGKRYCNNEFVDKDDINCYKLDIFNNLEWTSKELELIKEDKECPALALSSPGVTANAAEDNLIYASAQRPVGLAGLSIKKDPSLRGLDEWYIKKGPCLGVTIPVSNTNGCIMANGTDSNTTDFKFNNALSTINVEAENKNNFMNNILKYAKDLTLSKEDKLLREVGLKGDNLNITSTCMDLIYDLEAKELGFDSYKKMTENYIPQNYFSSPQNYFSVLEINSLYTKHYAKILEIAEGYKKTLEKKNK